MTGFSENNPTHSTYLTLGYLPQGLAARVLASSRQVRRVYPEFLLPPHIPILLCRIESALRWNFEGASYSSDADSFAMLELRINRRYMPHPRLD